MLYTRAEMLDIVGKSSFNDQLTFQRAGDDQWEHLDTHTDIPEATWSNESGLDFHGHKITEHTMLFNGGGHFFDSGRHVEHWLGETLDSAVEIGQVVDFHYVPADKGGAVL